MQLAVQSVRISQNEPNFCSRLEQLTVSICEFRYGQRAASSSSRRTWRTRRVPSKAAKAEAAKTAEFFATGRDCADKGRSRRLTQGFAQAGIASCADGTELTSDKQDAAGHQRKKSRRIGPAFAIRTSYGSVALPFIQRRRGRS